MIERLLERFLRYAAVDTTADENADSYPSSPGQLRLGALVADELRALGAADVEQDQHGLVWASIPASPAHESAPTIAFNSHFDTSPETTGANVRPQVVRDYAGGDLVLPGDPTRVIRVADNPELRGLVGKTLVTTDGTTLLGADDKAGMAVIVESLARWLERPELVHPMIRVLFTCDEEIGHGVDHVDLAKLGATVGYTLDGAAADMVDVETFSADLATIVVRGVNIHPSIAKDRMVNAIRATATLLALLPPELSPERTADRDGFLHPYQLSGGVAEVSMRVLLRDFDTPRLAERAELLRVLARETERRHPGVQIEVAIKSQYRNMADGLVAEPRAVGYVELAHQRLGRRCQRTIVRGGTDGSMLTAKGLPTPNLSTGQHNPHSPLEWACLEEMEQAVELLLELGRVWAEDPGVA